MKVEQAPEAIPLVGGLGALADDYDGFIVDLWGVIHGGVEPYPGVIGTLERLDGMGKPVVLLSNAPRRAAAAGRRLREIGVADHLYRRLVTSGEVAHMALRDRPDPAHADLGRTYLYIGPAVDEDLLAGLDYAAVSDAEEAAFLLCVGLFDEADPLGRYDCLFEAAAARGAPMVCVNPDLWVHRQSGATSPCAGLLAERYRERHGGPVIYHGKPDPRVFHAAADALGLGPGGRILVIGDSLTTDVRGAARAGFDSLFVTRGIFARDLGIAPGEAPEPARLAALCARHGERPVAATPTLRW
ncbi:MAG TPA: TIGR01459 family HAD-type hydrolase [Geminicoccaceae bacterium]